MMSSLLGWCTVSVTQITSNGFSANGEPIESTNIVENAYVASEILNIIDNTGHETISSTQIYLPGTAAVKDTDKFSIPTQGADAYTIRKIKGFYDGNTGELDIKVVYL